MSKKRLLTRSKRAAGRRRSFRVLKILLILASLGVIIFSLSFMSRSSFFTIEKVEVKGNAVTDTALIESIVFTQSKGLYLGLFSKKNILLYPKEDIEKAIMKDFPRVESVALSATSFNLIEVTVRERTPYALWCATSDSPCYFIGSNGFIFTPAPSFSPGVYISYRGSIVGGDPLGQIFLPDKWSYDLYNDQI